ncbi:MAG: pitrilysin family protein [Pseudomonadota bacterium]
MRPIPLPRTSPGRAPLLPAKLIAAAPMTVALATAALVTTVALLLAPLAPAVAAERIEASIDQPVYVFTLDNGMRAVVIEDRRAPIVTHMVWYPVGAADEPWGKSGIAHFLEHLLFKGTDTIPDGAFSKIIAENGGQDNAFTSWDYTGYFQRIAADRLGLVMSMEADRMVNLRLTEEHIRTERDVILEERSSRTDNDPGALFGEQMRTALYQNHPYGVPIIGWRHEMETLGMEDALAFYERFYAPDNAILVVAGSVDADEVERLASEHYGPLEPAGRPPEPRPAEPPQRAARRIEMDDPRVRQEYVLRYYAVPSYGTDPRTSAALSFASAALSEGRNSRLDQALVFGQGRALGAAAWYVPTARDLSTFGLYAAPKPGISLDEIEADLDAELARLAAEGPSEEEMARIRRNARADLIYAQDSQATLARLYGAALAVGLSVEDVANYPDLFASITAEEVQAAVQTWLIPERSVTGHLTRTPPPAAPAGPAPETPTDTTEQENAG